VVHKTWMRGEKRIDMIELSVKIKSCNDCRHRDHSGAFTPGGGKPICSHPECVKFFGKGKPEKYHWKHRVLDLNEDPPSQCPLRYNAKY